MLVITIISHKLRKNFKNDMYYNLEAIFLKESVSTY